MTSAEQFYTDNKNCKPNFPKVPDDIVSDEDLVRWLFKQNVSYIEIDVGFNIDTWQQETNNALPYLVPHRESDSEGWNSCCIHGIDIDKTGVWQNYCAEEPEYHWTELSKLTPVITEFWKSLPFESFARIRFMELEPYGNVMPHSDAPKGFDEHFDLLQHLVPFNIAVVHPEDCYMTLKDYGVVPWANGNVKLVNITNEHSVINFSDEKRIHMIGHGIIGNRFKEFCELIARSYRKQYERNRV